MVDDSKHRRGVEAMDFAGAQSDGVWLGRLRAGAHAAQGALELHPEPRR